MISRILVDNQVSNRDKNGSNYESKESPIFSTVLLNHCHLCAAAAIFSYISGQCDDDHMVILWWVTW